MERAIALLALLPVAAALLLAVALLVPRPAGLRRHAVFIRAPAQAVWDAYFMHVARVEYRPGRRILDIQTLATDPLTIRATIRMDYAPAPSVVTYSFPIYEPPHRYRIGPMVVGRGTGGRRVTEEGTLVAQDGGTWLRFAIGVPRARLLVGWLAARRVRGNLLALKAYCEGRPVPPPRPPLRWYRGEAVLAAGVLVALLVIRAPWVQLPLLALVVPYALWRAWDVARRF